MRARVRIRIQIQVGVGECCRGGPESNDEEKWWRGYGQGWRTGRRRRRWQVIAVLANFVILAIIVDNHTLSVVNSCMEVYEFQKKIHFLLLK